MNGVRQAGGIATLLLMAAGVCPASAQVVEGAPGSVGGIFGGHRPQDPNRTSQQWQMTVNLSGGRDTDPIDATPGDPAEVVANVDGTAAFEMRYWRGRAARSMEASAGGFINRESLGRQNLSGLEAGLRGNTAFGTRTGIAGAVNALYQPLALLGALGADPVPADTAATDGGGVAAGAVPPQGVLEQRWLTMMAGANAYRNLTRRQRLEFQASHWQTEPIDGPGYNARSQMAGARHNWEYRQSASLQTSYAYRQNRQTDDGIIAAPVRFHSLEAGWTTERRLSATRAFEFSVEGGVTHSRSPGPGDGDASTSWLPTGSGSVRFDMTRRWSLTAEVSREISVLGGVTADPFTTDQASLGLSGAFGPRLRLALSGSYGRGAGVVDDTSSFEVLSGSAHVQYGLARCCALFSSYSYYEHQLTDVTGLPEGFLGRFERHAVRVGITVWLPLYGTF
jgi:hypothetical protein